MGDGIGAGGRKPIEAEVVGVLTTYGELVPGDLWAYGDRVTEIANGPIADEIEGHLPAYLDLSEPTAVEGICISTPSREAYRLAGHSEEIIDRQFALPVTVFEINVLFDPAEPDEDDLEGGF